MFKHKERHANLEGAKRRRLRLKDRMGEILHKWQDHKERYGTLRVLSPSFRLQEGVPSFHAGSGVIRFTPHKGHSRQAGGMRRMLVACFLEGPVLGWDEGWFGLGA